MATNSSSFFALTAVHGFVKFSSFQSLVLKSHTLFAVKRDFTSSLLEKVLASPLYYPIVNVARDTMVKSARSAGVDWEKFYANVKVM